MQLRPLLAGAACGVIGSLSMTGSRTLAAELGLMTKRTPPERVAGEGVPRLLRPVPARLRPATIDAMHLAYGAAGGVVYAALPPQWRRSGYSGPAFGLILWLGYVTGIAPLLGLRVERRREVREWVVLAADHLLYGFLVSRLAPSAAEEAARS
jgi:hypothetical protein